MDHYEKTGVFSFILYEETSKIIGFSQVLPGHLNNGTGCVTERR